jgi:uncharacterized protein YdbL (DUF1318 family)
LKTLSRVGEGPKNPTPVASLHLPKKDALGIAIGRNGCWQARRHLPSLSKGLVMMRFTAIALASVLSTAAQAQGPINETYYGCIGQSETDCENKIARIAGVKLRANHYRNCAWQNARRSGNLENDLGQEICGQHNGNLRTAVRMRTEKGGRCGYAIDRIVCSFSAARP